MNTDKLRKLFESSTNKQDDARKMGITVNAMRKILAGGDMKVGTLEKIAKFYGVPVGYFFDESDAAGRKAYELEIENLKGQIKGMQDVADRLGYSLRNFIIEDY